MKHPVLFIAALVAFLSRAAFAANDSSPIGEPVLDAPTLHCLGVYWVIRGDDNQNARIDVDYRRPGSDAWRKGMPLFRVEKGANKDAKGRSGVDVPGDAWLFAGSIVMLEPATEYEIRLTLVDPDGGGAQKLLKQATLGEPVAASDAPQYHVVPGRGGGDGSATNPFKGLPFAQKNAKPGDIFLLHAGVYDGPFYVEKSGEPGKPIVWRGAGDGEALIDGKCTHEALKGAAVEAIGVHDVWFEKLSIANANSCIRGHESQRLVIRRCHLHDCIVGVFADTNKTGKLSGFFISDNLIESFMPWPFTMQQWHDLPESRGIWITGVGHVACYNRIRHMKDGLDTDDSAQCSGIDFHNNEVSEMFDDGAEMDGSQRNTRNYCNRYTNTLTGISLQPVYGGPVYVFRNVLYNFRTEALKLHNSPSGGLFIHNTFMRHGGAWAVSTNVAIRNCYSRNNLFLGTDGRAVNFDPKMVNCDFDHDGFGGWSGDVFLKYNDKYATPADVRARAAIERHHVLVDPASAFASALRPPEDPQRVYDFATIDARLKPGSAAVDAGEVLPNFSDGFAGSGPDLGAYELGSPLPQYGPRPER